VYTALTDGGAEEIVGINSCPLFSKEQLERMEEN
jgi:hypothetical protein